MTPNERQELIKAIGKFVCEEIANGLRPLRYELAELRQKIDLVGMSIRELRYAGTYTEGVTYKRGNFVTAHGSLWHCNIDTQTQPGKDFDAWHLCVKRGQDGKGA
jgi:hypothetical protein